MDRNYIKKAKESISFQKPTNNISKVISYDKIAFLSLAVPGSMGSPNKIVIAVKDFDEVQWYCFDFTEDHEVLYNIFPPLKTFNYDIMGNTEKIPNGFKHIYLGYGNHLLVKDDYYSSFKKATEEIGVKNIGEIYDSWMGIAEILLTADGGKSEYIHQIEKALTSFYQNKNNNNIDDFFEVFKTVLIAIKHNETFIIPVEQTSDTDETVKPEKINSGEAKRLKEDLKFNIRCIPLRDGDKVWGAFTCKDEVKKGPDTCTLTVNIDELLQGVLMNQNIEGLLINPWDNVFYMSKEFIELIFKSNITESKENTVLFETMDIYDSDMECIVNFINESVLDSTDVSFLTNKDDIIKERPPFNGFKTGEENLTNENKFKSGHIINAVLPKYKDNEKNAKLLCKCFWNCLELACKNDIRSITFPAFLEEYEDNLLEESIQIVLKTVSDWMQINPHYGIQILFAFNNENLAKIYKSIWNKNIDIWNKQSINDENNGSLERAIQFAMNVHKGAVRKGTNKPYILHPIETLQILSSMNADLNLMIAGLLHDTIEDTNTTLFDIYEQFGVDVAALVNAHTEDKRKIWYMRKLETINEVANSSVRQKMLVIADKVANLRSMYTDYKAIKENIWEKFNAPKHLQAWYYGTLNDGLCELQDYPETSDIYLEMTSLYKDLFVEYFIDEKNETIYQISANREGYVLKKGNIQWSNLDSKISENSKIITRKMAERIEDNWAELFWEAHNNDMTDSEYELFSSSTRHFSIAISNNKLTFVGHDLSKDCESINGKDEYEFWYSLNEDETHRFLVQLRLKHNLQYKLSAILKNEFGYKDGSLKFKEFCEAIEVKFTFNSY